MKNSIQNESGGLQHRQTIDCHTLLRCLTGACADLSLFYAAWQEMLPESGQYLSAPGPYPPRRRPARSEPAKQISPADFGNVRESPD